MKKSVTNSGRLYFEKGRHKLLERIKNKYRLNKISSHSLIFLLHGVCVCVCTFKHMTSKFLIPPIFLPLVATVMIKGVFYA